MFSNTDPIKVFLFTLLVLLLTACGPPSEINVSCNVNELIAAINDANTDSVPTIINLSPDCNYLLNKVDNSTDQKGDATGGFGSNGLPVISTPIIINGNNAQIRRNSSAQVEFRLFFISSTGHLTLNDLELENGLVRGQFINPSSGKGGAIFNNGGSLVISQSYLHNNEAQYGGGIHSHGGTVAIESDSTLSDNYSEEGGGAIHITSGELSIKSSDIYYKNSGRSGGGIQSEDSTVLIEGKSTLDDNYAGEDGGAIHITNGNLTIISTEIRENEADDLGGGIASFDTVANLNDVYFRENNTWGGDGGAVRVDGGNFSITNCRFEKNNALSMGGGLSVIGGEVVISQGTTFYLNTTQYEGAAIYINPSGTLTITDSSVKGNIGGDFGSEGGGIFNEGDLIIQDSIITRNYVEFGEGGGVFNSGTLSIDSSTISSNTAAFGGGIYNEGELIMINSTVSGNDGVPGGGILNSGDVEIIFSTIAFNIGDGIRGNSNQVIINSIVANNSPSDCSISGIFSPSGVNMDSDGTCTGFTITADPMLNPLLNNGGPTETHALQTGSPAIDAVDDCTNADGDPVDVDQRDEGRPGGNLCDIGAYEFVQPPPPLFFFITFITNVNCRIGPHYDHVVVFTYQEGETANAIGRNRDGSWMAVADPEGKENVVWCWVPDEYLDRDMDVFTLPVKEHLLSPDQLIPDEGDSKKKGCWWDHPLDNKEKACLSPCPNDAYSFGSCTP